MPCKEIVEFAKKIVEEPIISAIDIGDEIVFFYGNKDEYTGAQGIAVNKKTKLYRNYDCFDYSNALKLENGNIVNLECEYE